MVTIVTGGAATPWKPHLVVTLVLLSFMSIGCNPQPSTNASQSGSSALRATKASPASITPKALDTRPPPKTKMSLQQKSTKAIPTENGSKFFYQVVDQWVFQPDAADSSLICVEDGEHCITLLKLKEQLNRPANDPLGLR